MKRLKFCGSFVIWSLLMLVSGDLGAEENPKQPPLVIFLVRHAEKVDASRDPDLSSDGKARAKRLAVVLRDANLKHVHSSDFIRTRDTAAPIAARLQLNVELYDPKNLSMLLDRLRRTGGRHLVVGHSTTTPAAVKLLGGQPGAAINEAGEFDRLYIITVDTNAKASTIMMRYGRRYKERSD